MSYTPLLVGAGAGATAWSVKVVGQTGVRDWWTGWAIAIALCLLAYLTNPTPASFRTHLTSLSFHTHLRRLSSSPSRAPSNPTPAGPNSASGAATLNTIASNSASTLPTTTSVSSQHGKRKVSNSQSAKAAIASAAASQPRHVLSFSNRISLSIRTPLYKFTSYYLFSTVYVPSTRSTPSSPSSKKQQQRSKHAELGALLGMGGELWLGVFGRWYALKWWENEEAEEEERRGRLEKGVREMSVEDDDKDLDYPSGSAPSPISSHVSSPFSHDPSRSASSPSSASAPPLSPSSRTASANSTSGRLPRSSTSTKRVFRAGQRRSSPTSLTRLKSKAENAAREREEADLEAGLKGLKEDGAGESTTAGAADSKMANAANATKPAATASGESSTPDPLLVELQLQLDELRSTTAEGEKRLQDELEVLRGKKRDEDAFRAELKTKTKGLEEAKRTAEASRVEAERELNERKTVIKEVQGRVEKLRKEISALERKEMEAIERKEKKKRERKEREKKLREDVGKKKDELKEKEKGLEEVMQKVGEMERKLDVRRALLATRRSELAQLAGALAERNGLAAGPGGGLYAVPPQVVGATATLGGVGAVANAFAVPFGQGAYGRRNYPYVHPLSATSSRPGSIRSGHFDPHTGTFQSAPSSPTLSHPVSPLDDHAPPYPPPNAVDLNGGWPSSYGPAPNGSASLAQPGFLEHRLQHRAVSGPSALPSVEDIPSHFLPFDVDALVGTSNEAPSLHSYDDSSPGANKSRPPLALPLQYLDSGLLAGSDSPSLEGPLSPMTPHQTSLIPSQLFHMLDEDDEDEFVMPDSPTLRTRLGWMDEWKGLGLNVDDLGAVGGSRRKNSQDATEEVEAVKQEEQAQDASGEAGSPALLSPRSDVFPAVPSATTSPLGPPPASPFAPWDNSGPVSLPPPVSTTLSGTSLDSPSGPGSSTILHRLSPSQDLDDDLPRAGLSLNPDAKAFAFPFAAGIQQQSHARTSSVPSPPTSAAVLSSIARNGRSSSTTTASSFPGSALPSPTVANYPSAIGEPPAKSRMEFANPSNAALAAPLSASRFTPPFDWPRTTSPPKFNAAPGSAPAHKSASSTPTGSGAFNPLDEEDSLLGPLRK
ncbi:hypothetical protein JCM21900_002129 [Sporobolomyces salmonicolor]